MRFYDLLENLKQSQLNDIWMAEEHCGVAQWVEHYGIAQWLEHDGIAKWVEHYRVQWDSSMGRALRDSGIAQF